VIKIFLCHLILTRDGFVEKAFLAVKDDVVLGLFTEIGDLPAFDAFYELEGVVIPSLVNSHTHLELAASSYNNLSDKELWNWILDTIKYKRSLSSEDFRNNLRQNEKLFYEKGVAIAGDVRSVLPKECHFDLLRGVIFFELLGYYEELFRQKFEEFMVFLESTNNYNNFKAGVSIHSLYTTPFSKAKEVVKFARKKALPIMIHLAETEQEDVLFFSDDTSGFRKIFPNADFENHNFKSYADIIDFLDLGGDSFIVHCVNLTEKDWKKVKERGINVVFCPKSNLFWNDKLPDFSYAIDLNVNFMLGTDSFRTNSCSDLLEDAKLMYKNTRVKDAALQILYAITYKGRDLLKTKGVGIESGDVCSFVFLPVKCSKENAAEAVLTQNVKPIVYQKDFKNEVFGFFEKQF